MNELLADSLDTEDCIKTGMLILESLTAKGMTFDQQLFVSCSMLAILQASHPDFDFYKKLEQQKREEAQKETELLFGVNDAF